MRQLVQQISDSVAFIRRRWNQSPSVGIILGSGLGNFTKYLSREATIDYADVPHLPRSTVIGHAGRFVCGEVCGLPTIAMQGRFHVYEGYPLQQITLPVRIMKQLGVELLIVSNASGGLNPRFSAGDIVVIGDHINLMGDNPLIGVNDPRLGDRFVDLCRPYDSELCGRALEIARSRNFTAHTGVYAAVSGPSYETRAEIRFLRQIGADMVGMSTVPEVIVAAQEGMRALALSAVTNVCNPDAPTGAEAEEVIAAAEACESRMREIVLGVLGQELKE